MAIFKGLPIPLADETLTSWLYRCSVNRNVSLFDRQELEARPDWWWSGLRLDFSELDFDFTSSFYNSAAASLGLDLNTVNIVFSQRPGPIVDWNSRHFF